ETTFTGFGGPGSATQDIVAGPDGNLWFTESGISRVASISTTGMANEFTTNFSTFNIAVGSDNNLWFTEPGGPAIGQVTTAGAVNEFNLRASGDLSDVVTGNPVNDLWFTEPGSDKIGRLSSTTNLITEYYLSPKSE